MGTTLSNQQRWAILIGAATMLTLAMGMRQSLGLFQPHIIRDLQITAADFSFAIALQNIIWGLTQPLVGALVDKIGARPVATTGAIIYALGLVVASTATNAFVLTLGIGVCIGLALSCCASNVVMALAFFVCGLQLVFITTHLPTYLAICGIDPSVGAQALALIGLFNAIGSLVFGWLGGKYSKRFLLGGIYVLRSLFLTAYFMVPPTPTTTLLFAAAMGSHWLGVVPLVNGLVIHLFGLRYVATLTGLAFFSHQVGSFLGAWGGGLIYTALGSYEWAWKSAVIIGIIAGLAQMRMNTEPAARMQAAA